MKTLQATAFVSLLLGSLAAHAGTPSVSVTVSGEVAPGVYGEVQIGNASPPPLVYAQPMIVTRQPHHDEGRPLYLHVPPGHAPCTWEMPALRTLGIRALRIPGIRAPRTWKIRAPHTWGAAFSRIRKPG